jgi:hypothetical protein
MDRQRLNTRAIIGLVAAALSLLLMAIPALATSPKKDGNEGATVTTEPIAAASHGSSASHASSKSDHDGDADSNPSTTYTENNDTNDGGTPNNVSDAGDNAHPSGKDRSVENGGSGNQGKSESTPDQNGKGPERDYQGTDKPNGSGGPDKADQDGNNGCGNDDDFNDDNEGWCGHKPKNDNGGVVTPPGDNGGGDKTPPVRDAKVTICHATGSSTNPFVMITPSASGVFHGHLGHQDGRDIIPTFTYQGQQYSQNWDAAGQAIFNKGCESAVTPPVLCSDGSMPAANGDCPSDTPPVHTKVTICHATGSSTNPFVTITPSASGVFHGHLGHQDGRDIIPPFTYKGQVYSQNWNAAGQAIFNNGCVESAITPPVLCPDGSTPPANGDCNPPVVCPTDTTMAIGQTDDCTPEVLGNVITRGGLGGKSPKGDSVLGKFISKPQARKPLAAAKDEGAAQLPFTGSNIMMLLSLALGLLALGLLSLESTIVLHNASVKRARR